MHTAINIQHSHHYVNSSENSFIHVPIASLHSDHIYTFRKEIKHVWNELTFLRNELTILWNDLTFDWNDPTWNDLTMERNDRKSN